MPTPRAGTAAPSLEGRIAVVTGASSGIGRAIALALAERGAALVLLGREPAPLELVATEVRGSGCRVWTQAADLTNEDAIARIAAILEEGPGGVDILVHSIGRFSTGATDSASVDEFDAIYRTNVRAPFLITQQLLPTLRARKGQIVFINSSVVAGARRGVGQYAASKFALKGLADSLRDEVNPDGVRVLSVYPGRTATPMQEAIFEAEGRSWEPEKLLQPEDVAAIVLASLTLPRTAEVTELHIRPMQGP